MYIAEQMKVFLTYITDFFKIFKTAFLEFMDEDPMVHSASIAFYTIFSLPAVLLIVLYTAGVVLEQDQVQTQLYRQLEIVLGSQIEDKVREIVAQAKIRDNGFFAQIIGIGTLLFSATTIFVSLQTSLNRIWEIKSKPERGWLKFIINRLLSFALIVSIGFVLLVSLVIDTIVVILRDFLTELFSDITYYVVTLIEISISTLITTFVFALIFKVLPDAVIRWKDVIVGAFVTTILFGIGKYLIGFYLGNSSFTTIYGTAGSFVILLVWVYYSTLILLFGAEFTFVYSRQFGKKIQPYRNAVRVEIKEIETDKS